MKFQQKLPIIQSDIKKHGLDGWLLYDFRRSNDIGCELLEVPEDTLLTRRFFYWIPKHGEPLKLIHGVENHVLNHLPGNNLEYRTWEQLDAGLKKILQGQQKIAMEYSPKNCLPYLSKVDAGTMEMVRSFDVEVVSSADLLQQFNSVMDDHQLKTHLYAAEVVDETVEEAWQFISDKLSKQQDVSEYDVQQFILKKFTERNCVTDDAPLCAVNANAANPHYSPTKESYDPIRENDFILIDLSCKQQVPCSVFADITRMGVAAKSPTPRQLEIFTIVRAAQKAGTDLVQDRFAKQQPIMGWEVDHACRQVIDAAGYGDFFTHRTGHSLGAHIHGNGTHMDNFETKDTRSILSGTCFTIEPGIYIPGELGVRLEYDVLIYPDRIVRVTGGIQEEIRCLMP